jgi:hypothetical protein
MRYDKICIAHINIMRNSRFSQKNNYVRCELTLAFKSKTISNEVGCIRHEIC